MRFLISDPQQNIYTVEPGDLNRRDMKTFNGHTPSWTPDGRIISTDFMGTHIQIFYEDGTFSQAFDLPRVIGAASKPQMVGDLIIFSMVRNANVGAIWLMQSDGSNLRWLTEGTAAFLSPDAKWVSYTLEENGQRQIWRINVDGSGRQQLTCPMDPAHPNGNASAISPDGTQIAIFWGRETSNDPIEKWGQRDLAIMPATGGIPKVLVAATPATTGFPQNYPPYPAILAADNPFWGPDGSIGYDAARPDGTTTRALDRYGYGLLISNNTRGAGNVPLR